MRYFLDSTPEVVFAFWIAVCTLLLAVLLWVIILVMRWWQQRRDRRHQEEMRYWRKVFTSVLQDQPVQLAALTGATAPAFVESWNNIHDALPEAAPRLRGIAEHIGLSNSAEGMLRGTYHERAMAIVALGHQGNDRDFTRLEPFISDHSPIVSLCAARALAQIDASRAMAIFVPRIVEREDWVAGSVARILGENKDGSAARELSCAILRASDGTAAKLVRFLADIDAERAAPVISQLLHADVDDHVISACLQVVSDHADTERVRSLLSHTRWHVRMHAASALARLGDRSDEARLTPLLSDAQWWVRYRAAQALHALPGVGGTGISRIRDAQVDSFAQQIINHVLAEVSLRKMA